MAMLKEEVENQDGRPHIAFLCSPGMGHLIPMVELAKQFVDHHGFSATLFTFSNFSSPTQCAFLATLPPFISSVTIPLISLDDLPRGASIQVCICMLLQRSVPLVRSALRSLHNSNPLAAFVPDFFCPDTLPIAKELSIPSYVFEPSSLATLAFGLYLPYLDETTTCRYRDLPEPLHLPGCVPLWGTDFAGVGEDRTSEAYKLIVRLVKGYTHADGFLVNSFEKMEPETAKAFRDGKHGPQPAYAVGPFVRPSMGEEDESGCLAWLNKQSNNSVLFISFGSGGTLNSEQIEEIALGLEESGKKFLWVVRAPSDKEASGTYFGLGEQENPLSYLPEGFLERTKERGMVVPSWAPQVEILGHKATGGFLSHCGWNSTLESVCHGVPMISWPLYAEQRMNAVLLVDGIGIALRPTEREDGLIERGEVARVIRDLMEGVSGKAVRRKVEELKEAASSAPAVGGTSYEALKEVANKLKKIT